MYMKRRCSWRLLTVLARKQLESRRIVAGLLLAFTLAISGCASGFKTIMPQPQGKYEKLGPATGEACGTMLLGPTAYNFIPVELNSRVGRAYQRALDSVPGATALVNVTMKENWYWWVIGTTRCVTITGEAIR